MRYAVPQRISADAQGKIDVYFRVGNAYRPAKVVVRCGEEVLATRRKQIMTPGEMEKITIDAAKITGDITLAMEV